MCALRVPSLVVAAAAVGVLLAGWTSVGHHASTEQLTTSAADAVPRAVLAAHQAPGALVPGTPCTVTARACIDLSAQRAWLISGGEVAYGPVPITSGRPGHLTPTGTYRVQFKDIDHKSSIFNDAPMPYSVFFNGGVAFHQGSLKVPSHGCIHLSPAAARTYFASLKVGDVVQVRP